MGLTDPPVLDWRGKPLIGFRPERDIPGCYGAWDFSTIPGNDGDRIRIVKDNSGNNADAIMQITANRPTLKTAGPTGQKIGRFAVTQLVATSGTTWRNAAKSQPLTYVAVCKTSDISTVAKTIVQTVGGTFTGLGIYSSATLAGVPYGFAGAAGIGSGQPITDGTWHVIIATMSATGGGVWVDGYLVATTNVQTHGTNTANGAIWIGTTSSTGGFTGDMAEVMAFNSELTLDQIRNLTVYFNNKWSLGLTVPKQESVTWYDATDSGGQSNRLFVPNDISATMPLVIFNHQQGGTTALTPGAAPWYNPIHALVNAGYIVSVNNNHGTDSWTSDAASLDGANALAYVEANIATVSRVIVMGMSMGGGLSCQQVKDNRFGTKIKGVYIVDGGLSMRVMYNILNTSVQGAFGIIISTTAAAITVGASSFSSTVTWAAGTKLLIDRAGTTPEVVTVAPAGPTGSGPFTIPITTTFAAAHTSGINVSDYPTKTAGHDPVLYQAGDLPTGKRWRFVASNTDASAVKTQNVDVFKPVVDSIASPAESAVVMHPDGHLAVGAWIPQDVVAFADRCT